MSRMTTSRANLSWAMPAIRRACSSGVRAGMLATVEAKLGDQRGDRRWDEVVDRLLARDTRAHLARRDVERFDLEEEHAFGIRQLVEHGVETLARIPGTRRNGDARTFDDAFGIL